MGLLARLTKGEEPTIGLHGFNCAVREYARGEKSKAVIETGYNIATDDTQWLALIGLIDGESTVTAKTIKAIEIADILVLYEGSDSNFLYPNPASIAIRLGI